MISIIIPAYNEEKRIGKTLESYSSFLNNKKKQGEIDGFEIIVVLNACKDNTLEVVKKLERRFTDIKHLEFERGGKGFAIEEGWKEALKGKADLIGFVDADMATSPEAFFDLIKNIKEWDGIIASRYVPRAIIKPKQKISRIIVSRIGNIIIRGLFLLTYKDTQCGAKLFKKDAIKKILLRLGLTQWGFDIDLLYQAKILKLKVREYPTFWQDKNASKLNIKKVSMQVFLAIMQLRILNSPLKKMWWAFRPVAGSLYRLVNK